MHIFLKIPYAFIKSFVKGCSFTTIFFCFQAYPVILGDIDNSGSLSAQIIHQFAQNVKSKLVIQVSTFHLECIFLKY